MKSLLLIFGICLFLFSCRKTDGKPTSTAIGSTTIDLNAQENYIRKQEAEIGNLISDALKTYYENKGVTFDFVLINGGNIRYDHQARPDGIYKTGVITSEMVDEMLPFLNSSVIVEVTGAQLKQILERSVAQYPLAKGPFLQCSKGVSYHIDTLMPAQSLNLEEDQIISTGSRIKAIYVNNELSVDNNIYRVLFSDYIADGNDGFVTLKNITKSHKQYFTDNQTNAVKDYFLLNSPVNIPIEGRIIFE